MTYKIKFGTDGWRGVIAEDYTFDNVRRAAQGYATYMKNKGKTNEFVVVGHDKRFASENFAKAVAEVLVGNGLRVFLTQGSCPTPVIAFSAVNKKACGAINITASHNPPSDNGFKVRNETGGAIDPEGLVEIENNIPEDISLVRRENFDKAIESGKIILFDPDPAYIEHLGRLVDLQSIKDAGFRIVVDPMWGNGIGWFSRLLEGGKTQVIEIHDQRNPVFPEMKRPEPIRPNIDKGLEATVRNKADVLLITDGDADRLGVGDEKGQFINQLRVYGLLAYYLLEIRKMRGDIVKTLSTTGMLNILGEKYGVRVHETGVGFKFVAPKMTEVNALIGGEESGGYAFRDNVPERDGILAGLYFLDFMVKTGKRPTELLELLFDKVGGEFFYDRVDSQFSGDRKDRERMIMEADPTTIGGLRVVELITVDGFQFKLEDGGWLLIRFSGTEPILRVYCETRHGDKVKAILQDGLKIAGIK